MDKEHKDISTWMIKEELEKTVKERLRTLDLSTIDKTDTVTLYHGTSSYYLNDILRTGILARSHTKNNNWVDSRPSIENMTYMTNKWHYTYAINSFIELQKQGINDNNYPAYIECKVPKALLEIDEDFLYSNYMINKLKSFNKNNESELNITWEECLAQYATVGVIGNIPREYIVSFTILGEDELFKDIFISSDSQYYKEFLKWMAGKGKGKLKLIDLLKMEAKSPYNGTWWVKNIPPSSFIGDIFRNPQTNMLSIQFKHL
jgi:hypothetical protein